MLLSNWNAELVHGDLGTAVQQLKRQSRRGLSPLRLLARVGGIVERLGQVQWNYSDPTRRIRSNVISARCHSICMQSHQEIMRLS
jgi:hypothetical protein